MRAYRLGTKPTGTTLEGNFALGPVISTTHSSAEPRPLYEVGSQDLVAAGLR